MPLLELHPTEIARVLAEMFDEAAQRVIGRSRFALAIDQAQGTAVSVTSLEPLDAGDSLGQSEDIGLHQSGRLEVRPLARVDPEFGENHGHVRFLRIAGRQHPAQGGNEVEENGFGSRDLGDAVEDLVGMQGDEVEMVLRPGEDDLFEIVDVRGLGGETDEAIAAYEQSLAEARQRANDIAKTTRERVQQSIDAERAEAEAGLAERAAEAEKHIAEVKAKAMGEVDAIATETAEALVTALGGGKVTKAELSKAVSAARG